MIRQEESSPRKEPISWTTNIAQTPKRRQPEPSTKPPAVETLQQVLDQPVKVKLQLLQHYAEMARLLAGEIMDEEVETLAGKRYSRAKPCGGRYRRWGSNPGSICVDGERVPALTCRAFATWRPARSARFRATRR